MLLKILNFNVMSNGLGKFLSAPCVEYKIGLCIFVKCTILFQSVTRNFIVGWRRDAEFLLQVHVCPSAKLCDFAAQQKLEGRRWNGG